MDVRVQSIYTTSSHINKTDNSSRHDVARVINQSTTSSKSTSQLPSKQVSSALTMTLQHSLDAGLCSATVSSSSSVHTSTSNAASFATEIKETKKSEGGLGGGEGYTGVSPYSAPPKASRGLYRAPQPTIRTRTPTATCSVLGSEQRKVIYGVELLNGNTDPIVEKVKEKRSSNSLTSALLLTKKRGKASATLATKANSNSNNNARRRRHDSSNPGVATFSTKNSTSSKSQKQSLFRNSSLTAPRLELENSISILDDDSSSHESNSDDNLSAIDYDDSDLEGDDDTFIPHQRRWDSKANHKERHLVPDSGLSPSLHCSFNDLSVSLSTRRSRKKSYGGSQHQQPSNDSNSNHTSSHGTYPHRSFSSSATTFPSGSHANVTHQALVYQDLFYSDNKNTNNSYSSYPSNSNNNNPRYNSYTVDEMTAMNYQSDILFVETGGAWNHPNHSSKQQPLYKIWLNTMKTMQRQSSSSKEKIHASKVYCCRFILLRFSSCVNNFRNSTPNVNLIQSTSGATAVTGSHQPKTKVGFVTSWLWQLMLFSACGILLIDSQRTIRKNRIQLQQYDEERAHILEQMTWIDQAAKRVQSSFLNQKPTNQDVSTQAAALLGGTNLSQRRTLLASRNSVSESSLINAIEERDLYKQQVDKMQIAIQSNARYRNRQQFGDQPIQISLPITVPHHHPDGSDDSGDNEANMQHLVIALWDDTPHAVSTLLQQINKNVWDDIDYQRIETSIDPVAGELSIHRHKLDSIQIAPKVTKTRAFVLPSLEFVEKSRKCSHVGSVALHQLESDDFRFIILKVKVADDINHHSNPYHSDDDGDVCVGSVVQGLDSLIKEIPHIQIIRREADDLRELEVEQGVQNDDVFPCDKKNGINDPSIGDNHRRIPAEPLVEEKTPGS